MNGFIQIGTKLTTRILRTCSELSGIGSEWTALCDRCAATTPFQRPEWVLAWIEAFCPNKLAAIEVREGGRLVGLAPLLVYSRRLASGEQEDVLAFAGGGVSDYLDILAWPGKEQVVVTAICAAALAEPDWAILELTDLSNLSPLIQLRLFEKLVSTHDRGSALALPAKNNLLQTFSKRQRANLRNAHSRLQRAGGGHIESSTIETLPEFLNDLFRLHTSRWAGAGQAGVFSDGKIRQFHQLAAPGLLSRGIFKIHRLQLDSRTIAVLYSLWQQGTVYCYLQGFDPACSNLSPGTLLMFSVIEEAARLGMGSFDFLRGDENYKQHWRAHGYSTFRLSARRGEIESFVNRAELLRAA